MYGGSSWLLLHEIWAIFSSFKHWVAIFYILAKDVFKNSVGHFSTIGNSNSTLNLGAHAPGLIKKTT
jgi:hypothetical protein